MSINIKEFKKQKKKRVRTWKQVLRLGKQDCDLKMGGGGDREGADLCHACVGRTQSIHDYRLE